MLKDKKILIISDIFITPITNYILNHVVGLLENGANIQIVASSLNKNNDAKEIINYCLYDKVSIFKSNNKFFLSKQFIKLIKHFIFNPRKRIFILKFIKDANKIKCYGAKYMIKSLLSSIQIHNDVKLVHSHSISKSYEYLYLKVIYKIPLVTTFHGLPTNNLKQLNNKICMEVFKTGDVFFVNTNFAKNQIIELGCNETKVRIIPQGTKTENFPFSPKEMIPREQLNIMSLCRLSYDKGLKYLIDAVEILRAKYPYVKHRIVGSGPQERELRNLARNKNLEDNILFCGQLKFKEVIQIFALSDIFVLASIKSENHNFHEETQAVVIQEAQSMGIPVVATRVGGIPDCNIHDETAILVNDKNGLEIAQAIERLKIDHNLYKKLSINGRSHVMENFDSRELSKIIASQYNLILQPK